MSAYRNQDWCQNIAYQYGKFSNTERSTCNLFQGKPKAFDVRASNDFKTVAEAASSTGVPLYLILDLKYSKQGKLNQAKFHLTNCSCYYVYSPNYHKLPEDIPNERRYTIINQDWYFVQQDWM